MRPIVKVSRLNSVRRIGIRAICISVNTCMKVWDKQTRAYAPQRDLVMLLEAVFPSPSYRC